MVLPYLGGIAMLEDLKETVCQANVDLARQRLGMATWGNVSGIARETRRVVIKPRLRPGLPYFRAANL